MNFMKMSYAWGLVAALSFVGIARAQDHAPRQPIDLEEAARNAAAHLEGRVEQAPAPQGEREPERAEHEHEEGEAPHREVVADAHAAPAHAEPSHAAPHGGGHGEAHDPAGYILHHVQDSEEWELEWGLPFGAEKTLHISQMFAPLKFESPAGACAQASPTGIWSVFPSLGAALVNGCWDLRPSKAGFFVVMSGFLLLLVMLLGSHTDKTKPVPRGVVANLIEVFVVYIRDEIAVKNIGREEAPRYTPYLCTAFFFVLFMNWMGLIPGMFTATSSLGVTLVLAVITFVLTQAASIRAAGLGGYLAHLTGGVPWPLWPIMIPVEFLGLFTKPFALMMRLFANMLAGHIVLFFLLGLIFILTPIAGLAAVPMAVAIYFLEIFVGILQAFIFTMLSALFIGMGVAMGHHGHDDAHTAHGHEGKAPAAH